MRRFSITPKKGLRIFDSGWGGGGPHVTRADHSHTEPVAVLFDEYRQFYGQEPDLERARGFISERLRQDDSVIFLALDGPETAATPLGFTQLYPSYSSVATAKTFILNDLYVRPPARKRGVGQALLRAAREHARVTGAKRVQLETATDNAPAQRLYEQFGFVQAERFLTYLYDI